MAFTLINSFLFKMKILHITNGLSEGGVENLLYFFSKALLKKGHSVTVLVLARNEVNLKVKFEKSGIRVIVGKYENIYNILNIPFIKRNLEDYDIVHAHLFPVQFYVVLANMLLGHNRRVLITTEHNTWNNRRKYQCIRYLDRWFYNQYEYIIGISDDTSVELNRWLINERLKSKIVTINNGVEQVGDSTKELSIEDFNCSIGDFILVMVARFDSQKDQETLINALTFLPQNVHVIFVGSGETLAFNRALVSKLKLDNRVFFAGYRSDVPSILKIAHLGVLCSNWEGFGLSIVEYMIAGLPVIASNVLGLGSVVGWDELLYTPKDHRELANKILHLMNDEDYYNIVKEYCMNRCQYFTVDRMADEYLLIYRKVMIDKVKE